MGQSLLKLTPGSEVNKSKIAEIAKKYYEKNFSVEKLKELDDQISKDPDLNNEKSKNNFMLSHFYRGVCEVVEDINTSVGNTQFRVPTEEALRAAFDKHHRGKSKEELSKEEFQRILQDAIMETGFTGIGAKDVILYIFGVPATALFIKKGVLPKTIPNEFFIPAVTSATVFALSKFNKI